MNRLTYVNFHNVRCCFVANSSRYLHAKSYQNRTRCDRTIAEI